MENFGGNYSRATKIKIPLGMKAQNLIVGSGRYHGSALSPTRFDSENVDLNAPIIRYLCGGGGGASPIAGKIAPRGSRSPLSSVENLIARSPPTQPPLFTPSSPAVYRTPVKAVEGEEVLVMDGVSLRRSSRFSGSESSGSSGKSLFKAESFHSSEFSNTKEDTRPPRRISIKNKTESQAISSYINSPTQFILPETLSPTFSDSPRTPKTPLRSSTMTPIRPPRALPVTPKQAASRDPLPPSPATSAPRIASVAPPRDWSPEDDGIEVTLPSPSKSESVNAYIDSVLSGDKARRLPVFLEICTNTENQL